MMRHILRDLEWGIVFVIITLVLFLIISWLTIKPVIATVTETEIAPGQIHCRSEQLSLVEEWQQLADRNYHLFPKLPYTLQIAHL